MEHTAYREIWNSEYRGVKIEVAHWSLGWNYYILIPVDQLPNKLRRIFDLKERIHQFSKDGGKYIGYDYSSTSIISDLGWHGGITLYEKQRDDSGKVTGYKLGCDYLHYFDTGINYTMEIVFNDAMHSVDKLWEFIPNLKLRCSWNGKYYDEKDTYLTDKGVRVALENKTQWERPLSSVLSKGVK